MARLLAGRAIHIQEICVHDASHEEKCARMAGHAFRAAHALPNEVITAFRLDYIAENMQKINMFYANAVRLGKKEESV
jgi:hypothetical protein